MKNLIINIFFVAIGFFGAIAYQTYLPFEPTITQSDSTKIDSIVPVEVSPFVTAHDTIKKDTLK